MGNTLATVADAATQTNYKPEHIRALARQGVIKSQKIGATVLVSIEDLQARREQTGGKPGIYKRPAKTKANE